MKKCESQESTGDRKRGVLRPPPFIPPPPPPHIHYIIYLLFKLVEHLIAAKTILTNYTVFMDYTNYNNYSNYSNYTNNTNHEKALFVSTKTIWYSQFSHDVAKIQTKKLLIPLCFYFHKVLRATFCKYHR